METNHGRLKRLADSPIIGLFVADLAGNVLDANEAALSMVGYSLQELRDGRIRWRDLLPPQWQSLLGQLVEQLHTTGIVPPWEQECLRKDGTLVPILVGATLLADAGQDKFIAFMLDLSAQKRAEARLRQSEQRFRLLIDAVADYAIYMLDLRGQVMTWSPGATTIEGYESAEVVGQEFRLFSPPGGGAPLGCEEELKVAAREGRFHAEGWRVRKDGSRFWANVVLSAIREPVDGLVGFAAVIQDLTERRRQEEIRLRLARAEEAVRLRDEFLSIVSHELRTPLTPLKLQAQAIERRVEEGLGVQLTSVQRVNRNLRRLERLVGDLLDLNWIRSGSFKLQWEDVDVTELAHTVLEDFRGTNPGDRFELRASGPAIVRGDWMRIEQVLVNLLQNAVKFSPSAGRIQLSIEKNAQDVRVTVADEGIGIPREDQPQLFQRFFRGGNVDTTHYGGLGLGLFLCNEIVTQHGGSFEVKSEPGRGSAFTFRLPVKGASPG